jgi:outer membrane lipoprotein
LVTGLCLLGACTQSKVVPPSMESQVDKRLTFAQLKESPDSYRGHLIVLGGAVLSAKRLKDGTRIEVLQLPLDRNQAPGWERTASEGRFLAIQRDFLDPATLPAGTRVTIVGEVLGATTLPLDETEYVYPTVEIKHLKVWQQIDAQRRPYPYPPMWSPYYGYGPYGPWGYPYRYWR